MFEAIIANEMKLNIWRKASPRII